jgi:hypothetical protein
MTPSIRSSVNTTRPHLLFPPYRRASAPLPSMLLPLILALGISPVTGSDWANGKNRINLQSHIGFNIKTEFSNLGQVTPRTQIGLDQGGVDHFYDDGFNRVDAGGNAGGQTWFWGYDNPEQIVGNNVLMSSTTTAPGSMSGLSDAPHWGMELNYARELGFNGAYWWGIEVGLSWLNLNVSERGSLSTDAYRTVDSYSLGGITPPAAPYSGSFATPGPTIGDNPQRSVQTLSNAALTTGTYELDAYLYALRFGLIYETPFTDRFTLQFGGGVVGAFVQSDFSYQESSSVQGFGSLQQSGSNRETDFLAGAYARAGLGLHFSEHFMASLGVQYNYLGNFSHDTEGRRASVDLKSGLFLSLGLGVRF